MAGEGKKSTQMSEIASQTAGPWQPRPVLQWVLTPSYTSRGAHDLCGASPSTPQLRSCPGQKWTTLAGLLSINVCLWTDSWGGLTNAERAPFEGQGDVCRAQEARQPLPPKQVLGKPPAQFFQDSTTAALQASARTISITMLPLQTQNKLLLSTCQLLSSGGKCLVPIAFTEGCLFSAPFRFCCSNRLLFGFFSREYCSQSFPLPRSKHSSFSSKYRVPVHSFCLRWYTRYLQCKAPTRT